MIPVGRIEDVKRTHELVAFVEASGIKLRRQGASYVGLCPFHGDSSASLAVHPEKQYWCCHGSCSAGGKTVGGDVIEFARRIWGLSFPQALERLAGDAPASPASGRSPLRLVAARGRRPAPRPGLLEHVMSAYQKSFLSSLPAKEYLASRALTDPDVLAALPVGYADGSLLDLAPEGSDTHEALLAAGILAAPGRELLEGCVVFPLRDLQGQIVSLYGRGIADDRHRYLPGPRRGLVNAACAATADELVFAESIIDALSFLVAGIPNVVPVYGIHGWTRDHDALLEQHRIRRVVLALDSDGPGREAAEAIAAKLRGRGLEARTVTLPAKDPNELLVREGPEGFAAIWKRLLAESAPAAASSSSLPCSPVAADEPAAAAKEESSGLRLEEGAHVLVLGSRTYRVRGLSATGMERLRVSLRLEHGERFHVDTLDLYSARGRGAFVEASARVLELEPADVERELLQLIDALEKERLRLRRSSDAPAPATMTEAERQGALAVLRAPDLLTRIQADFATVGCVGEDVAMLVGFLAAISRKLPEPLAVLFCARSGAGKSNIQLRITDLVPPEDLVRHTRITGQALFYKDENALVHKVLAIDEEEGAAEASYALRNLQSAGYLSVSATRTDPQTGKQKADDYKVNGPTAIFLTTAHPEALDYESRNRFVILTVNESREQTKAILAWQRWADTLPGVLARKSREEVLRRHHDMQRLLDPLEVVNPFAADLQYPSDRLILRREQKKYLSLIKTIALLHQHQRPRRTAGSGAGRFEYIEVVRADVDLAAKLAQGILRRNLDELAPPSRSLLDEIRKLAAAKRKSGAARVVFDRRELQKGTGLSLWHLRAYIAQLVEYEYIAPVQGCQGKRVVYELLWEGDDEDPAGEIR